MSLGEVDHAMDDIIGLLQQTESDLQEMDDIYGDPKLIETHLKKLQVLKLLYLGELTHPALNIYK